MDNLNLLAVLKNIDWIFAFVILVGGRYWGSRYFRLSKNPDLNFLAFATIFGAVWIVIQKTTVTFGKEQIGNLFLTYLFATSFYQLLAKKIFVWLEKLAGFTTFDSAATDDRDYIQYPTKANFPNPGATNTVYLDLSTDTVWYWDVKTGTYKVEGDRPTKPPRLP